MSRELRTFNLPEVEYDPDEQHTAMITVRLPHATHVQLMRQARQHDVSLNSLAVAKIVSAVNGCQVWRTRAQKDKAKRMREEIRQEVAAELRQRIEREYQQKLERALASAKPKVPGVIQQVDDSLAAIRRDAQRIGGTEAVAAVDREIAARQPQEAQA